MKNENPLVLFRHAIIELYRDDNLNHDEKLVAVDLMQQILSTMTHHLILMHPYEDFADEAHTLLDRAEQTLPS